MIHGILLVNKPVGISSHDVVKKVRRLFPGHKVGHFGTLDPQAEGLLIVAIGKTTRFFDFFRNRKKTYSGTVRFGCATSTYDSEGEPVGEWCDVDLHSIDINRVREKFSGKIMQVPPVYSAKKLQGKPLYKYARKNVPVEIAPVEVNIYDLQLHVKEKSRLEFLTQTSSGTYIRSLAHDMGAFLGCGAFLETLKREAIGEFSLQEAVSAEYLDSLENRNSLEKKIVYMEALLPEFPKIVVSDWASSKVLNGNAVTADDLQENGPAEGSEDACYRIFDTSGVLLAFARQKDRGGDYLPFMVFPRQ